MLTVPNVAVIVTELLPADALVVIVNATAVAPGETVTDDGTVVIEGLLLVSLTTVPGLGAGPDSVTVPVTDEPASTVVGDRVSDVNAGGFTLKEVLIVTVPSEAVIVAVTGDATGVVPILKFADIDPPTTTTEAGTVAQL